MKREQVRATVDAMVRKYGIQSLCRWIGRPAMLEVTFGGHAWQIAARGGMSAKDLAFELGKLDTIARLITRRLPAKKVAMRKRVPKARQVDLEELTTGARYEAR